MGERLIFLELNGKLIPVTETVLENTDIFEKIPVGEITIFYNGKARFTTQGLSGWFYKCPGCPYSGKPNGKTTRKYL